MAFLKKLRRLKQELSWFGEIERKLAKLSAYLYLRQLDIENIFGFEKEGEAVRVKFYIARRLS